MDDYFSNFNMIKIFLKWKWHLLILMVIAGILAIIISSPLIIKPKFKSSAVLYPANILPYSEESETEQLLQWLNSNEIMDSIVVRFDLARHYDIPREHLHYNTIIENIYHKNVIINKTKYESVNIEVFDTDPLQARDMVNTIIDLLTLKIRSAHREKYAEVLTSNKIQLDAKKREIDSVLDLHHTLRTKYGIIDYGNQAREVARGFLRTVDGNNAQLVNSKEIEKLKANLEEKGGDFIYANTLIFTLIDHYARLKIDYENTLYHYNKKFTYANIVSHPVVADKKTYPVRWIIVAFSLLGAALFGLITIVVIESAPMIFKKLKDENLA